MNGKAAAATDPATKVLLSFAVADFGSVFAHWLRDRIMVARAWYAPDSVYVDNVAMRSREGTDIRLDTRHQAAAGVGYIGAMNPAWNESYLAAMSEARAMIFVVTPGWVASENCKLEWAQYRAQNAVRMQGRRPPLKGIALLVDDTQDPKLHEDRTLKVLAVRRVQPPGFSFGKGSWVIGEQDLQAVLQEIPRI